jgi:hypothetical protein
LLHQTQSWYQNRYQESLVEIIVGAGFRANTRDDPKLTVGNEIVRELPRPSSTETFSD